MEGSMSPVSHEIPWKSYEVLVFLAGGKSIKEVATLTGSSTTTVNTYLRRLRNSLRISRNDRRYVDDLVRRFQLGEFTQRPAGPKPKEPVPHIPKPREEKREREEKKARENARWEGIFKEKFADSTYYLGDRQPLRRSSLIQKI